MTNSTLQWHDAEKETPPAGGEYLIASSRFRGLRIACWLCHSKNQKCGFWIGHEVLSCDLAEYWAAIPTPAQVKQKFRDEMSLE